MTKKSHGPLKCPKCSRRYTDPEWFKRHVQTHDESAAPSPVASSSTNGAAPSQEQFEYPTLEEWSRDRSREAPTGVPTAAPTAAPGTQPIVHFSLGPAWVAVGNLIDATILKEKEVKIGMTPERAAELDASLASFGFQVQDPAHPVIVPWWMPIAINLFVAFGLPIISAFVLEALKKRARAGDEKAKEKEEHGT